MSLQVGEIITFERTFTVEDVEMFTKVSGDQGTHHLVPDENGRLIIQGLLTATLPTKIGGDYNVLLAQKMTFEFIRPVFTTDTIRCDVKIEKFEEQEERNMISAIFSCRNQKEKEVMRGDFSGLIIKNDKE